MKPQRPQAEDIYRHFKGNLYQIITIAKHSETGEDLVIYRALYGDFKSYARPLSMFLSEVDKEKYPDSKSLYRFTKLESSSLLEEGENKNSKPLPAKNTPIPDKVEVLQTEDTSKSEEGRAMELFMEFLDEGVFDKKRNILRAISPIATPSIINSMAASLDLVPSGNREEDLKMIGDYISARIHFDGNRLR